MKRLLMAGALAFFGVGHALAADLPQPAPPPPQAPATYVPTVAPVYNWGGIYWGVNAGYGIGSSTWSTPAASTGSFDVSGALFGGTLGANFQTDAFVFGIEGDYDGSWMSGSNTSVCAAIACQTKNNWLATVRARAGYAADRVLFYGTAGGAFGSILANTSGTTFQKSTEPGWTAGAGIEAAFADNWTARVEYLYVSLENASFGATPITVKFNTNLIRAGIDYKFR